MAPLVVIGSERPRCATMYRVRAWIIWSAGLLAYIVAVLNRTTLGVSGLSAADRFSASPGVLSAFVVLQVVGSRLRSGTCRWRP